MNESTAKSIYYKFLKTGQKHSLKNPKESLVELCQGKAEERLTREKHKITITGLFNRQTRAEPVKKGLISIQTMNKKTGGFSRA